MNEEWKIELRKRPAQMVTDIWIFRRNIKGIISYIPHNGYIAEEKEFDANSKIPPSIVLPDEFILALFQAIRTTGIKLPDESFTKGKLDATQNHLKDLRHLLK